MTRITFVNFLSQEGFQAIVDLGASHICLHVVDEFFGFCEGLAIVSLAFGEHASASIPETDNIEVTIFWQTFKKHY